MKYKMIFSDFDGTLLRDDLTVSEKSKKAIKDYIERGGKFVLCTGRMPNPMVRWINELGLMDMCIPVVGFNGAVEMDKDGKYLHREDIDHDVALKIVKRIEMIGDVYFHFYGDEYVYIEKEHPINTQYVYFTGVKCKVVGKLSKFLEDNPTFRPIKILTVIKPEQVKMMDEIFDNMDLPGVFHIMSSHEYYEFCPVTAGKGLGMERVAKKLGVSLDDVIAIGDNQNDIAMIQKAGLGVAVANARKETLEQADYVTLSNDDDGVAHVIEKFCKE